MYKQRMKQLDRLLSDRAFDLIILLPGSNLNYLTGLTFHLMERPIIMFVAPGIKPILIVPELERIKVETSNQDFALFAYGDEGHCIAWQQHSTRWCGTIGYALP
jgi:Xaa-Pro dipeptidase